MKQTYFVLMGLHVSVRGKYEIVLVRHSPCPFLIGNCGRELFFGLSFGGQSLHTLGRLQERGCKCVEVNANNAKKSSSQKKCTKRVDNKNEATEKTTDNHAQYEYNNQKNYIAHRSTTDESVSNIHDYVGGFDDVNPFDLASDQRLTHELIMEWILMSTQQRLKQ